MATPNIPEGELPYADLVREAEPYLDTAPRGPYLITSARNAVRRVCKDLSALQNRVQFEKNKDGKTYVLDHAGYDFCQMLAVYFEDEGNCRLDPGNLVDIEVGQDTTTWTFTLQERFYFDRLLVRYSVRPSITSKSFPRMVMAQYSEILRIALLADMIPYVHDKNKRMPSDNYERQYRDMLNNEKYRSMKGQGPEEIGMFTRSESDYRY